MTDQHNKEIIACLKFELAARELGAVVSKPTTDFVRYDYIVDLDGFLFRVQVKYGGCAAHHVNGAVNLNLRKRLRGSYLSSEIDALAVYMPQIDRVCWFGPEIFNGKPALHIRYAPTKITCQKAISAQDHIWGDNLSGLRKVY